MQRLEFSHPIYKISPDPYDPYVGIEIRDSEQRKAYVQSLACAEDGHFFSQNQTPLVEVAWWVNMLGCFHGVILYHSFEEPEVPRPTALHALDGRTGELLWTVSNRIWQETLDAIVRVQSGEESYEFLDLRTGQSVPQMPSQSALHEIRLPVHYPEGNVHLATLQKLIRYTTENHPIGACDYLELTPLIIISYYFYESEKLKNNLLVVTNTGQVQFHEPLSLGDAQGHTTFINWRHQLIYIKDQVYLCCYAVS
ncbi:DUF4905 domain-containing protein [Siphonobacter sp. SORGH_AS_0500]|uniref:DUF4905 domain-containing protein n=1 Tax=Siphonobacter sp. SORGH_AS_0500 TaxID=1864824 RepID=UPI000D113466|nr:DUF4905 domain-containing protein [Siphonobacter sp. SORGH_AS_0500]